jgi:hypothetical protein
MSVVISTYSNTKPVDAAKWNDLSINELFDQRNIMYDRLEFVCSQDSANEYVKNLMIDGINKLEALIAQKSK